MWYADWVAGECERSTAASALPEKMKRTRYIAIAILVLSALGYACWPRFGQARYGGSLCRCYNQMQTLADGVLAYEKEHGHYPPPYVVDSTCTPMHSWRVLILPYIGEFELFAKYDLDEPWDGPNNSKLESLMPAVYRCPEPDQEPRRHLRSVRVPFIRWNENKFTLTAAWCSGDFNANGVVDGEDFVLWNGNKFMVSDGLFTVPEPSMGVWIVGLAILATIPR